MIDLVEIADFEKWSRRMFEVLNDGTLEERMRLYNQNIRGKKAQANVEKALQWINEAAEVSSNSDELLNTLDTLEGILSETEREYVEERTLGSTTINREYID